MAKVNSMEIPVQEETSARELSFRYYAGQGDDAVLSRWGEEAINLALDWLKNAGKEKIHPDISLPNLSALFQDFVLPEAGSDISIVFRESCEKILSNSVRVNNPRYIGHMTAATPWFSVLVDILITAINQNQVKIETALSSSFVERQTIAWLHRLVYRFSDDFYRKNIQLPSVALGNMTGGGTMGNLTALTAAREASFPGVMEKGLLSVLREGDYNGVTILASRRVHYSLKKSSALLGFGRQAVTEIPVDSKNQIRLDVLEETIARLKREKIKIIALVGIAGTTETGNIDPLRKLGEIARREKIWFHVDAAWGGAFLLSEKYRGLLDGIEMADSVVMDGHKLFYLPISHGVVLFKDVHSLDMLSHNANYVLRKGSVDLGRTSLEGSRRFDAFKLWFALKVFGSDGYSLLLHQAIDLTAIMADLIDQDADFERANNPETCILNYRFIPKKIQLKLQELKLRREDKELNRLNSDLNNLNIVIQRNQRERGKSFVSRTVLESTGYDQEIVVFRAIPINPLTQPEHCREILEEQREIGFQIIEKNREFERLR